LPQKGIGVKLAFMIKPLAIAAALSRFASSSSAQPVRPAPCPPAQAGAFAFIVGTWEGKLYDFKGSDSTYNGVTEVVTTTTLLNGCAIEEHFHAEDHGATESDGVELRAFDAPTQRWHYAGYTTLNQFYTYDGEYDGAIWRFFFHGTIDGKPAHIRISWVQTPWGYSKQIARSADGTTWVTTRHFNFTRRGS
jgi:hypothetical protein